MDNEDDEINPVAEAARMAAEDMRERAAKLVEDMATEMGCGPEAVYVGDYRYFARKIRALPIDGETT